jgi:uracil-DNA glycosylase
MEQYISKEIFSIIKGYSRLDGNGNFSALLKKISRCNCCASFKNDRHDLPLNYLVRSLPLQNLRENDQIQNYSQRIKRDDTFLRNLFQERLQTKTIIGRLGSAKFAIGLNPWLDRCMLFRKSRKTKLMIIGIDYKHFPVFHKNRRDHNFPLDSYETNSNIWGPTWTRFWKNLLGKPYDDSTVNKFLREKGVFITNSMLCFGGSKNAESHFFGYLECCRHHIRQMTKIVKPEILVSFGDFGCRNVASLLHKENKRNKALTRLAEAKAPLEEMKAMISQGKHREGIKAKYNSHDIKFLPLYQPARSHINKYDGDYHSLKRMVKLR